MSACFSLASALPNLEQYGNKALQVNTKFAIPAEFFSRLFALSFCHPQIFFQSMQLSFSAQFQYFELPNGIPI
jgi:hypothetical protein